MFAVTFPVDAVLVARSTGTNSNDAFNYVLGECVDDQGRGSRLRATRTSDIASGFHIRLQQVGVKHIVNASTWVEAQSKSAIIDAVGDQVRTTTESIELGRGAVRADVLARE